MKQKFILFSPWLLKSPVKPHPYGHRDLNGLGLVQEVLRGACILASHVLRHRILVFQACHA